MVDENEDEYEEIEMPESNSEYGSFDWYLHN